MNNIELSKLLKDVTPGEIRDDAQYLSLMMGTGKNGKGETLFSYKKGRTVFKAVLRGETEIINEKGIKIKSEKDYEKYLKKGRAGLGLLNSNNKSFIEIVEDIKSDKRIKPLDVVFSMADGIKILEEEIGF